MLKNNEVNKIKHLINILWLQQTTKFVNIFKCSCKHFLQRFNQMFIFRERTSFSSRDHGIRAVIWLAR